MDVKSYSKAFKCLDNPEEHLLMKGNYDTEMAANLMIVFDICNDATSSVKCKPQEEIDEFLKFKYLIGLWN